MKKNVKIIIHGKVQGVGFRFSAVEKALEWNLTGTVQNYEDNKLELEVEGELDDLQKFLKWCHRGPEGAKIEKVDFESSEELKNFEKFEAEWFK